MPGLASPSAPRIRRGVTAERLTQLGRLNVFDDLGLDGREGMRPWLEELVLQGLLVKDSDGRYSPAFEALAWWRSVGDGLAMLDEPVVEVAA